MQDIAPVTPAELLAPTQEMRYKLEVYADGDWHDLSYDDRYGTAIYGTSCYRLEPDSAALPGDYLKSISLQLGGAGMSPDPIAGTWSAEIDNEDGIFHPFHPTSPYADLLRIGREVRISVGGNYGGITYYWQRLIGYMDAPRFDHGSRTVQLSGMDYAKRLVDFELRSPGNYWGDSATFSSIATTENLGAEQYAHTDAVRVGTEADSMNGWTATDPTRLSSETEGGGGSTYVGQLGKAAGASKNDAYIDSIGSITSGKYYKVTFKYCVIQGNPSTTQFKLYIYATGGETSLQGGIGNLKSWDWTTATFYFTSTTTGAMRVKATTYESLPQVATIQFDELSIKELTSYTNDPYPLPDLSNGPYLVTLDDEPIFLNDPPEKHGWLYNESSRILSFVEGTFVAAGVNNLVVYYYTDQVPEEVVADILAAGPGDAGGGAGLYADQATALAAMSYTATGIIIPRVWFSAGTTGLEAIRKVCERVNYRFWFDYAGVPHFQPAPVLDVPAFEFTEFGHLQSLADFQDIAEVRNRIVIEGAERAIFRGRNDLDEGRWRTEVSDAGSIAVYLEKTHNISNHLFQDQASVDALAAELLAEFRYPRWYSDLGLFANPVPLELGDTVEWTADLTAPPIAGGESGKTSVDLMGIIRDISIRDQSASYKIEIPNPESGSSPA